MLILLRGGGIKLFKKIIDRYNLGNEYKDLKTNVENCSSSEDEYYYYKFATIPIDSILELSNTLFVVADETYINGILYFNNIDGAVGPVDSLFYNWITLNSTGDFFTNEYMNLYIKINKKPTYVTTFKGSEFLKFELTGNLYDRISKLSDDATVDSIKGILIESTEEEYNNAWKDYL